MENNREDLKIVIAKNSQEFRDTMSNAQINHFYAEMVTSSLHLSEAISPPKDFVKRELIHKMGEGIEKKVRFEDRVDYFTGDKLTRADVYIFSEEELISLLAEYQTRVLGL